MEDQLGSMCGPWCIGLAPGPCVRQTFARDTAAQLVTLRRPGRVPPVSLALPTVTAKSVWCLPFLYLARVAEWSPAVPRFANVILWEDRPGSETVGGQGLRSLQLGLRVLPSGEPRQVLLQRRVQNPEHFLPGSGVCNQNVRQRRRWKTEAALPVRKSRAQEYGAAQPPLCRCLQCREAGRCPKGSSRPAWACRQLLVNQRAAGCAHAPRRPGRVARLWVGINLLLARWGVWHRITGNDSEDCPSIVSP